MMGSLAYVLLVVAAVGALAQPQVQYYQPAGQSFLVPGSQGSAHPVFEQADQGQAQALRYQPQQPLAQPLLSHTDRQIQKAAKHLAGPAYVQQIQALQLQGQAQQAQDQVQRNALRLATAPRAQPQQYQQRAVQADEHTAAAADLPEQYNNVVYRF